MKDLRTHLTQAQKVIMATCILHNMASDFGEEDLDAEEAVAEVESQEEEAAAQVIGRLWERAEGGHDAGRLVRQAMMQARFLSINSLAISLMNTTQLHLYFNFNKFILKILTAFAISVTLFMAKNYRLKSN